MATIDASIPLGVRQPQIEPPINQLAKLMQIQGFQQQNELGRMQMDEYQRGITETNALNQLYQSALKPDGTIDRNALYRGAAERGMGSKLPALQKGFMEQDEAAGKVAKQKIELVDASLKKSRAMLDYVRTPEEYLAWHKANHADPILGPELASRGVTADQAMARIQQALQVPGGFQRLLQESALGLEKFTELNKPHFQKLDSGQQEQVLAIPGLGGAPQTVASVQKVATPDAVLSAQTSTQNNIRTVQAQKDNAQATRDAAATTAQATRDAASIKDRRDTEMKLADDYRAQSKTFKDVADAHSTILASLDKATTSPAATLAGATKFMKLLDPGSVVRESELGMALNAQGVFDRAANYVNELRNGKVLTPKQVQDFKTIANQIYSAAQQQQKQIDSNYQRQAQTYGLRPDTIIQDLGQNKQAPTVSTGRESAGKVTQGPSVFEQADAILRGGR